MTHLWRGVLPLNFPQFAICTAKLLAEREVVAIDGYKDHNQSEPT